MIRRIFNYLWWGDATYYDGEHLFANHGIDRWLWIALHIGMCIIVILITVQIMAVCLWMIGIGA